MKRATAAVLTGFCAVTTLLPLAAGAATFQMDCSKPMYISGSTPAWIKAILLDKGVSALLPVSPAVPEGGVVLSRLTTDVTSQGKYFGPARWTEYTCHLERLVISKRFGDELADVYAAQSKAVGRSLMPDDDVEKIQIDACRSAIEKALSGFSCKES